MDANWLLHMDAFSESNLQVRHSVSFSQSDLKHVQVGNEGSQAGQTLLATSTNSNEQSITPRSLQDPVYSTAAGEDADSQGIEE